MTIKDIKTEARKKLALNIHQAIMIYTVEFAVLITLIALIVMSCVSLGVITPAAIVMICYGVVLCLIAIIGIGMVSFAMCDFYLATYRCKPYNIRRLGDTLARSGITKLFLLSLKRTLLAFLLLLCLIVPGVIYLIRTSVANYLLIANPKMNASTALSASNKVMSGKTGSYFALSMSLIGWYILGILTLGLGFVFILPYTNLIKAVYYKRALQGDKTIYNTVVQPVSVMPAQQQFTAVDQQAQPQNDEQPAPQQDGVVLAPIDTLADDDMQDMAEAMRDFDGNNEQAIDVREVPLAPITAAKNTGESVASQNDWQVASETPIAVEPPIVEDMSLAQSHAIDGTSIVETERVLSTLELDASNEIKKRAIEAMYSNSGSRKSEIDYFSMEKESSPDDFFVNESEQSEAASEPINIVQEEAPPISDSDFDAFLKDFDNMTENENDFEPLKQSEKADTNADTENVAFGNVETNKQEAEKVDTVRANAATVRPVRERPERAVPERVTPERAVPERSDRAATERPVSDRAVRRPSSGVGNNSEVVDRAERIRREREERLNLNNKK